MEQVLSNFLPTSPEYIRVETWGLLVYFVLVCIPHSSKALYSLTFNFAHDHEIEMNRKQIDSGIR